MGEVNGISVGPRRRRIVVIDDSKPEVQIIRQLLEDRGHTVTTAASIREAEPLLEAELPELVLLDLRLPEGNGYDLIRKYRSGHQHHTVEFIVVTGNHQKESVLDALKLGARDYVEKDRYFSETLTTTVDRVLDLLDKEERIVEMESKLSAQQKRFEKIMNNVEDGIWEWRELDGDEQWWSYQNYRILGYEPDSVVASYSQFECRVHPEDIEKVRGEWGKCRKKGQTTDLEYRIIHPDGEERWIRTRMLATAKGENRTLLGINEDITQKRSQKLLIDKQRQMLRWSESFSRMGSIKIDPHSGQMEWTDAVYDLFELPCDRPLRLEEMISCFKSKYHGQLRTVLSLARNRGRDFDLKLELPIGDGREKWIQFRGMVHHDPSGTPSILASIQDVSEQVEFERQKEDLENELQQAQKMEAIGTLAGGIAHDFNNILAIQYGFLSLIKRKLKRGDYDLDESVDGLQKSAERARDLVAQILRFSRKRVRSKQPLNIATQLKDILKFLQYTLPSSVILRERIQHEESFITGDPTEFHQIIMNLCTNAAQSMVHGSGEITVSLDRESDALAGCDYWRVSVEDNGEGIPESLQNSIFEPYFTTKEEGRGTGIGLHQVKKLVESMQGRIHFQSQPGVGTAFHISFPFGSMAEEELPQLGEEGIRSLLIYYVEDDHGVRESTRLLLESMGSRVMSFHNARDCLDRLRCGNDTPDVVISDLGLPGENGLQLAKEVWNYREDLPFILVTGNATATEIGEQDAGSAFARIRKPYSPDDLVDALARLTRDHSREFV